MGSFARKITTVLIVLLLLLVLALLMGLAFGSTGGIREVWHLLINSDQDNDTLRAIIWQIRLPRVILAAVTGATLSLGGLVFQALLRNPLAEPYILGVSGGSAVGAISGMLLGLTIFPGVALTAFAGSMFTLLLVLGLASGHLSTRRDTLLLGGVMINAFYSAVITFLISLSPKASQVHQILFWLMGDFSMQTPEQLIILTPVLPCMIIIYILARPMNLLLLGEESAAS
ncbi:MAG: iron ABC transporter permease, partial [Proteobacteria bacterium]|nr:iron ABC transporter permease [Pseudomonadota bacterium]